jgi:hypothetical protein
LSSLRTDADANQVIPVGIIPAFRTFAGATTATGIVLAAILHLGYKGESLRCKAGIFQEVRIDRHWIKVRILPLAGGIISITQFKLFVMDLKDLIHITFLR